MFKVIENAILLGYKISFLKTIMGFKIVIKKIETKEIKRVVLPYDHLTETKISRYIDLMIKDFEETKPH